MAVAQAQDVLVSREARVAGLRDFETPTLEAVSQRRAQLWTVAFVVLAGMAAGLTLLSVTDPELTAASLISPSAYRLGLLGVTLTFSIYVIEKEVHLRRLARLLTDERVISSALTNRLREVSLLSEAAKAVNSVLELEPALDVILASAGELLGAESGSVLLAGPDGLRVVCAHGPGSAKGDVVYLGHGAAGRVAETHQPLLAASDHDVLGATAGAVMAVPLLSRGVFHGVLVVRAGPDARFGEYDLRVLTLFAEHAASAVANASLFEAERRHVAELLELNHMRDQFVAMVSHEFKNPLTSILGAARTLRRPNMREDHAAQLLDMIVHQADRLGLLVREVLDVKRAEAAGGLHLAAVDVAALVRDMARVSAAGSRPVHVRLPESADAFAIADANALEQIVLNLIDNAFNHGEGAVEVEVEREATMVRLSVLDRGPGVPAGEEAAIFDPFRRGPAATVPGSGLGLYLVKTLVEAQGGNVAVTARAGGGADFSVRFPATAAIPEPTGAR